jgi:hypothetical protein
MCTGVALLFVTSFLIITTPPYPSERFAMEKHAASQGTTISLSVHPVEDKQFLITVTDEKTGAAVPVTETIVTLENTEKNIGPIVPETDERFSGGFTFPRKALSVPGRWTIDITARRTGAYDAAVSIPMDYPAEFEASRIGPDVRILGSFEIILAFVAVSATVVSFFLYRYSAKQSSLCNELESRGWSKSDFNLTRSLAAAIPAALLVCTVIWIFDVLFLKSGFQTMCEGNGDSWTQSVPMRAGITLASETMAICSNPSDDFHFADIREYTYFLKTHGGAGQHQQHQHP